MDENKLVFKRFDETGGVWMSLILAELREIRFILSSTFIKEKKEKADRETARDRIEARYKMSLADILRERADLTVREVASELGVSKTLVAEWRKAVKGTDGK